MSSGSVAHPGDPLVGRRVGPQLPDLGQVHPGAERRAVAREDGDAEVVVAVERSPRVVEPAHHLAVDGVALLGSVERDEEDVTVLLDEDGGFFGHRISSSGR